MRNIYFIIPTLSGGGAERVFVYILKHIDRKKFIPRLILFRKEGPLVSEIPADVTTEVLLGNKSRYGLQWLVFIRLARLLKKNPPDVILSFMWYTNFVTLLARRVGHVRCAVVASERYGLAVSYEGAVTEFLRRIAIRFFYPGANAIIVNAKEMGRQLESTFGLSQEKLQVIYNPVDIKKIRGLSLEENEHPWYSEEIPIIVGIGRLTQQKGFYYLVKALHLIIKENIQCRLVILGCGPEEENLRNLSVKLKVDKYIDFPGFQKNPYKYLSRSTVFALSSLYEGLPNVLLEALALGVASVVTRCPTGPEEIVTDGIDGMLVPPADEVALAAAIRQILVNPVLRKQLQGAGKKRADYFEMNKIIRQYETVCAVFAEK